MHSSGENPVKTKPLITNSFLEPIFKLSAHHTTPKREILGGITTFLTMAYIIFVNPNILGDAGMDKGALITVTCLAAFLGTVLVGFWANVPFAMGPGMGLNAFFTYTLVIGQDVNWETALGVVFISGIFFLLLTFSGFREKIVNAIPFSLRIAVAAGMGLFIAFIGFQNLGLVVQNPATLVGLGEFGPTVILGLMGLIVMAILEVRKVKGSLLIGIVITTILGVFLGQIDFPEKVISLPPSIEPLAFQLDIFSAFNLGLMGAIFSFMFVDLFDSVGTIVACAHEAGLTNEKGEVKRIGRILTADALASIFGAILGTSTTTTFVESASGIGNGARTGLAALSTAFLFLLALFFTPLIGMVPAYATAPALIIVGVMMFRNVRLIELEDFTIAIPAFMTIILMPLTYS
ncbi:NCS2 family permease, partial [Xanthovirga aplysinae]|uniref:NCS2 family permease n=1 Tax=Xanthovirga aplysinae TaxID=2529853 RepID=UPI0012BCE831